MTLETSEREFAGRFEEFAATGVLYPQREGSPLLEFAAGGRVLYLFDRSGPYAALPGEARVVVHGVLDPAFTRRLPGPAAESLTVLGVSGVEGQGTVLAVRGAAVVVQARLPLVLGSFEGLPALRVGDWLAFRTVPPLHGFLL
ncbi:hypothetical protein GCM10008937_18980 [Deinococcus depolymerans]|uniref:Uncharacterized protein n=1 Tax=Deinococcus depolymerans TaxID=392408 RepID=A0ABP3M515_9DEIO